MMKNTFIAIAAVVILGAGGWFAYSRLGASSGTSASVGATGTVASVNGENITRAEFDDQEAQIAGTQGIDLASSTPDQQSQLKSQALDALIAQKLLGQAAKSAGVTASTTAVDAQVQTIKQQVGGDQQFQDALKQHGLTEDVLRQQIASGLAIQMYLEQELHLSTVTATDAEVKALYDKLSQGQSNVPPLKQVQDQVRQLAIQQKQQQLVDAKVQELRASANVQTFI